MASSGCRASGPHAVSTRTAHTTTTSSIDRVLRELFQIHNAMACYKINQPDTTTPLIRPQPGATSGKLLTADTSANGLGISLTVSNGTVAAKVGLCTVNGTITGPSAPTVGTFPLFEDEEAVTVRILPDRSVVDFFVQGGRFSGTQSWISGTPRTPEASQITLYTETAGVTADIDVYGMGCGWEYPSYTENPTM